MRANLEIEVQLAYSPAFAAAAPDLAVDTADLESDTEAGNDARGERLEYAKLWLCTDEKGTVMIDVRGVMIQARLSDLRAALKALAALDGHL